VERLNLSMTRFLACFFAALVSVPAFAQTAEAPATPVRSSVTTTATPEVSEFQKIEDSWSNAINARDQYGLELILSPLFVGISATGDVSTRNQQVADLISGDDKTLHLEQHVITVRTLGDIAVANGTYVLHHKVSSGQVDEKGVFTHVFQKVRGGWLCVNSQQTTVKTDSKTKKSSTADQPFHIPLFSKSDK
jgi:ketosteroid isomerase-like protein